MPARYPPPQAYYHPSPLSSLVPHLIPLLPNSFPLLHCIQSSTLSPHACVFATFSPSTPLPSASPQPSTLDFETPITPTFEFAALWVDRSRAPETEAWIFSTYELRPEHKNFQHFPSWKKEQGIDYSLAQTAEAKEAKWNILALLNAVADLPYNRKIIETTSSHQKEDNEDIPSNPSSSSNNAPLIIGSLHSSLLPLLTSPSSAPSSTRVVSRTTPTTITDLSSAERTPSILSTLSEPCLKFFIPPSLPATTPPSLPQDYSFTTTPLSPRDIQLTQSRTDIPRSITTLAAAPSVGVRYHPPHHQNSSHEVAENEKEQAKGGLIAWAHISIDGSLANLHTEPAHRGKGIGAAVCRELVRRYGGAQGVSFDAYWDNEGGVGVARGSGGRAGWMCFWVGVDLGGVKKIWGEGEGSEGGLSQEGEVGEA
ncbi:MAG: hypothetical protein Q9220_001351 [cf. Caloplaca sp. 1 TL-2023]